MSATKWKTQGFVRPWTPRNWPIPHIGECRAGEEFIREVTAGQTTGRAVTIIGGVPPGFAAQPLMSAYDRVALMD